MLNIYSNHKGKTMKIFNKSTLLIVVLAISSTAYADWTLDSKSSSVQFNTVKKETVKEQHTFHAISGSVSAEGLAKFTIELASVDTKIQIRNERMQQHLFETEKFPKAVATTNIDVKKLLAMKAGDSRTVTLDLTLALHGVTKAYATSLLVKKLTFDSFQVSSVDALIIEAADFGLLAGVEKLRDLAKLSSISPSVPVMVDLTFAR
ncbi:MAG: polyisoprenoid-binding protein YceI [Flavobacteriales bacterium]|jgi:polyisoprenoid-binding protein YceI